MRLLAHGSPDTSVFIALGFDQRHDLFEPIFVGVLGICDFFTLRFDLGEAQAAGHDSQLLGLLVQFFDSFIHSIEILILFAGDKVLFMAPDGQQRDLDLVGNLTDRVIGFDEIVEFMGHTFNLKNTAATEDQDEQNHDSECGIKSFPDG